MSQKNLKFPANDLDSIKSDLVNQIQIDEETNSEENYLLNAINNSVIVAVTDKNGTITFVNKKFCQISKYLESELLGQNHRILKSGYHSVEFYLAMWATISKGKIWTGEIKNKAKDGSYYWVKTTIVPILNDKKDIVQYVSIRTDITKQKNSEEKLNQALDFISRIKKFKQFYDNSPDLFRIINTKGEIIQCNETYATKLGYAKEEIIGSSIYDHASEESKPLIQNSFETWKKTGNVQNKEIVLKKKDGTTFPGLLSANTLYDEFDNVIGSNTIIRDMSDIFEAKSEIEKLKQEKLSILGKMAARLAHDIKNPLSVIKSSTKLIEKNLHENLNQSMKNSIKRMNNSITRISHQIDDVLEFLEVRGLDIQLVSIKDILDLVFDSLEIPEEIKISLTVQDTEVECDPKKLEIVFINLILNAIQAIKKDGDIRIRIFDQNDSVVIEIEDSGHGISSDIINKIFEPLVTTKLKGTGLGLSSCKIIVEQHCGTITVKTNPTVFVVTLPKKALNNPWVTKL